MSPELREDAREAIARRVRAFREQVALVPGEHRRGSFDVTAVEIIRADTNRRYEHVTCPQCGLQWQRIDWKCALHALTCDVFLRSPAGDRVCLLDQEGAP
jgi:hypothetical protein